MAIRLVALCLALNQLRVYLYNLINVLRKYHLNNVCKIHLIETRFDNITNNSEH